MLSRKNKMVFMETNNISSSITEILQKHSTEKISGKQQTFSLFYDEICPENRVENYQI